MNKYRLGKELSVIIPVRTNKQYLSLEDRDITVELTNARGAVTVLEFATNGHFISFTLDRDTINVCGVYTITIWENKDKSGQTVRDLKAF